MVKNLIWLICLMFFSTLPAYAGKSEVIDLTQSPWEYRWGDSPFEKGVPVWGVNDQDTAHWKAIKYPSDPPDRNGQTNIWYRVKLPDTLTKDPHFYVLSMDIVPEVYFKGTRIYHFGELDENGKGEYAGWPWHMFALPDDAAGNYLYFRLFSNYLDIGLFGEILIASKGVLLQRFMDADLTEIMVGSVSVFVSLIFLLSFASNRRRKELFILGSLFLTQGFNMLCSAKMAQMYLFPVLVNQYILAFAFYYFPVGMAWYLDTTVRQSLPFRFNVIRRIGQIHLVYLIAAISGALLGFFELPATYEVFDCLYYFFSLPIMTACLVYFFVKGSKQVRLITFSFLIVCVYHVLSHLISAQIIEWIKSPDDAVMFVCLMMLSYSIIKNLNYAQELEYENEELTQLTTYDYLTKVYTRRETDEFILICMQMFQRYGEVFAVIMLDVDDFKKVNDEHGHLVGDEFLVELGQILMTQTRETDRVGRWGGEEFIVVCPKAGQDKVLTIAEKLRRRIEGHSFPSVGKKTVSLGVAVSTHDDTILDILSRADDALYASKNEGKNRVSFKPAKDLEAKVQCV